MKDAMLNGVSVFFATLAGFCLAEVIELFLPWQWAAMIAGGIIAMILVTVVLVCRETRRTSAFLRELAKQQPEGE